MAVGTVSAEPGSLDRLTDALGQHYNIRLWRQGLDRLDVEMEGAAYPLGAPASRG